MHKGCDFLQEFIRIGEKLISIEKIKRLVIKILSLRSEGCSQQEIAERLNIDRSFISRLESLGAVRKGKKIALVAFPVKNKEEVTRVAKEMGVDFTLVLTNKERWRFIEEKSGIELFNEVMQIIADIRTYDVVILIGSRQRIQWSSAFLDKEVVDLEIGESPLTEDKYIDSENLRELINMLRQEEDS